jgi:hypothetical protein
MGAKRMRTSRQQLIEEPATLADRTANGAGAQCERVPALEEAARNAVEELAYTPMNLPLEDWSRISSTILSALEPSNKPGTFDLDQIAPDQLVNISRPESQRALEPSAARELALEERLQAIEQQLVVNLGYFHDEKRILLETLQSHIVSHISAIRALSSPDHADAGKVEGDGWMPIESAPKDGTPFLVFVPDDDFSSGTGIDVIWYDEEQWLFGANTRFTPANNPTHWRPLPSAPSQEVAGS